MLKSTDADGNNGCFVIPISKGKFRYFIIAIASDGEGWEHVSAQVTDVKGDTLGRTPTWEEMCVIKDIFWDKSDFVIQIHPPEDDYVNNHPFVLHLWRPTDADLPQPNPLMVGIKKQKDERTSL